MSQPGTDKAMANLTMRDDWRPAFDRIAARHFGPVCDSFDIEFKDIAEWLGSMRFLVFTTIFEPDGGSVFDDYLKRRGWRETAPGRGHLAALRRSVTSLYEVVGIVPGRLALKDLVQSGEPVTVKEKVRWNEWRDTTRNCATWTATP